MPTTLHIDPVRRRIPRSFLILGLLLAATGCAAVNDSAPTSLSKKEQGAVSAKIVDGPNDGCYAEYSNGTVTVVCNLPTYGAAGQMWDGLYGGWWNYNWNSGGIGFGNGEGGSFDGTMPTVPYVDPASTAYGSDGVTAACQNYSDCWQKVKGWLRTRVNRSFNEAEIAVIESAIKAQLANVRPTERVFWMNRLVASKEAGTLIAGLRPGDAAIIASSPNPLLYSLYSPKVLLKETQDVYHGFPEYLDFLFQLTDYQTVYGTDGHGSQQVIYVAPVSSYQYTNRSGTLVTTTGVAEWVVVFPDAPGTLLGAGGYITHRCFRTATTEACGPPLSGVTYPWNP